jgi:excisionase family DNA binding protein
MPETNIQRLTRLEACSILRISLATLENRIRAGEINIVRDGKRVFILRDELDRYATKGN